MRIIGIDIGGTFTDVVVYDEATRRITAAKALTRRGDEAASVLECLEEAAAEGRRGYRASWTRPGSRGGTSDGDEKAADQG